jgi:predicted AlkP superfamily pyrophosphatase or phosphodiesterase
MKHLWGELRESFHLDIPTDILTDVLTDNPTDVLTDIPSDVIRDNTRIDTNITADATLSPSSSPSSSSPSSPSTSTTTTIDNSSVQLFITHFLGVDHIGHTHHAYHPLMTTRIQMMDQVLMEVINALPDDAILFLMGDHGMTDAGEHGK